MLSSTEFEPLLAPGFHEVSIKELRQICVDNFSSSKNRPKLLDSLISVLDVLRDADVPGKVWIDGSFLTCKLEPNDVDIVLETDFGAYETGSAEQKNAIDWINSNLQQNYNCDSYVLFSLPHGHREYGHYDWMRAYWIKQFGFSRGEDFKGMAIIDLQGGGL